MSIFKSLGRFLKSVGDIPLGDGRSSSRETASRSELQEELEERTRRQNIRGSDYSRWSKEALKQELEDGD